MTRPQVMRTISTRGPWKIVETDSPRDGAYRYVEWTLVHASGRSMFAGCYAVRDDDPGDRMGDRGIRFAARGVEVVRENGTVKKIRI